MNESSSSPEGYQRSMTFDFLFDVNKIEIKPNFVSTTEILCFILAELWLGSYLSARIGDQHRLTVIRHLSEWLRLISRWPFSFLFRVDRRRPIRRGSPKWPFDHVPPFVLIGVRVYKSGQSTTTLDTHNHQKCWRKVCSSPVAASWPSCWPKRAAETWRRSNQLPDSLPSKRRRPKWKLPPRKFTPSFIDF